MNEEQINGENGMFTASLYDKGVTKYNYSFKY